MRSRCVQGGGCRQGVGRELGRFVVTTMEIPWSITKDLLGATPEAVLMVESMEQEVVERQIALAPECDTVLAIGGGRRSILENTFEKTRHPPGYRPNDSQRGCLHDAGSRVATGPSRDLPPDTPAPTRWSSITT
ncbi:MAG: hypothetical protein IPJ07_09520 [Acidobacteria bacterium]|nr:hypothetical protein [Acidobacteriota bacterium]